MSESVGSQLPKIPAATAMEKQVEGEAEFKLFLKKTEFFPSRSMCKAWFMDQLPPDCLEMVGLVIPFAEGKIIQFKLLGNPAGMKRITDRLASFGTVRQLDQEEVLRAGVFREVTKKRKESIADYGTTLELAKELMSFHGGGGKGAKKRRMAQQLSQVVATSSAVASATWSELRAPKEEAQEEQQAGSPAE